MGIQDRDYYRERHAPRRPTTSAGLRLPRLRWSTGRHLLVWIFIASALTAAIKLAMVLRAVVPFPDAGVVHWFIAQPTGPTAALTLKAPSH